MTRILKFLVIFSFVALITACGGGGGGGDGGGSAPPASSSDWDTMTWDQDNWS